MDAENNENHTNALNIVVVICHDLGCHLGCYGRDEVRSPNINRFAKLGHCIDRCFCVAPQCSPSRAALWTGRYPHSNGVVGLTHGDFANDLNSGERHFAQILGDTGYETHLFGIQHESPEPARCGYQHIHEGVQCHEAAKAFTQFISNRENDAGSPFFAQIGFHEPHRPFKHEGVDCQPEASMIVPPFLPDIAAVRRDLSDLEASVAALDLAFGRILNAIESSVLKDKTFVVFTSDHGIPLPRAKMTLYDPGLEVALLFSIPGLSGGHRYPHMVSNVDVLPTLLQLLEIAVPESVQGISFLPLLLGDANEGRDAVFAEKTYHTYYDPMRCIRTDRWKMIANFECAPAQETAPDYSNNGKGYVEVSLAKRPGIPDLYHPPFELYDLQSDPHELVNLANNPQYAETFHTLVTRLNGWMRETGDPLLDGPVAQRAYERRMSEFKRLSCV